jgi:hypothetical protein
MAYRKLHNTQKALLLVGLLLVPSAMFYFFMVTGVHRVSRLPFYGPVSTIEVMKRGRLREDTVYYEVVLPELFARANGDHFDNSALLGSIWVGHILPYAALNQGDFFFPKEIIYSAKEMLSSLPEGYFVTFIQGDTAILNAETFVWPSSFSSSLIPHSEHWVYAWGSAVDDLLGMGGFFPTGTEGKDPQSLVLVDKEGRIRGFYNPIKAGDVKNLSEDLLHLRQEYTLDYKTHRFSNFNPKIEQKRPE